MATRPERTKSIYTKPIDEDANANGSPLDTNRNPQQAPPPSLTTQPPLSPAALPPTPQPLQQQTQPPQTTEKR